MIFVGKALAAVIAVAQSPAPIQTGPLTLDQAAAVAERNAFAVRLQESRVEQTRQRVEEARAGLLPRVNGTFGFSRLPQAQTAQIGGPGSTPVIIQPQDQRTVSGSIQFPIDVFGNVQRNVEAGRANLRASRTSLQAVRNDVRLNAKAAYFGVLRAQAAVGVAAQAVKDSGERLEQARKLLQGEQIARVEVTRLEAQLAQSQAELELARNTLELQKNAFNVALARPVETPVELVDVTTLPEIPGDGDALVQSAQETRPEVRALRESLVAASKSRRALEAGLNPSLTVGFNYQRNLDAGAFAAREQTIANLTVGIPIFDGGATRARVRAARQDEEQARINVQQTQLAVSQEVRNAFANLATARARLASATAQVAAAQEVYRLAPIRQEAGEATYVEIVDALTQLIQARNTVVAARYDYLLAFSQLQRAVGSDGLTPTATPPTSEAKDQNNMNSRGEN